MEDIIVGLCIVAHVFGFFMAFSKDETEGQNSSNDEYQLNSMGDIYDCVEHEIPNS